ncbi:MAG: mannonate dehydratase [Bacteroidota bacterium]|nr:mannonate dehydratase [Bacteroidota bacterium]
MALEQTWRWFGPNDPVSLEEIRQTGATGIVTALHHVQTGDVWNAGEVMRRRRMIEAKGLHWAVVESLPVHEKIKKRSGNYKELIENYKTSIRNLGACGVTIVCYNFMPVFDWSRTDLAVQYKDGSLTTKFEAKAFAAFDLFLLKRPRAEESYTEEIIVQAQQFYEELSDEGRKKLVQTVLLGHPGSGETYTLSELLSALETYKDIARRDLQDNLFSFLKEIVPVAEESHVRLVVHPDDPPWQLLGLPRIVGTEKDIELMLSAADSQSNGLTFCTGSLGAGIANDCVAMAKKFSQRVNFIHLRNVSRNAAGDFVEENHLEGDIDLAAIMKIFLLEQKRREEEGEDAHMPFRPDHGHLMLDDQRNYYPGYSLYGRVRALAELRGIEAGILHSLQPQERN